MTSPSTTSARTGRSRPRPRPPLRDDNPTAVAVSPDGGSVYVTNNGSSLGTDDSVSQYDVGAGGALAPKSPPRWPRATARRVAVSPDGGSVYAVNVNGDNVSQYDVGAGGALAPKSPATIAAGDTPIDVAIRRDGESVYVTNRFGESIVHYGVGAGGALTFGESIGAGGETPEGLAVSPNGRSVYVAQTSSGGDVLQYNVDDGGALAFKNPPAVDADFLPLDVAVNHVNFHYDVTVELGVSETPQCLSQDYALEPGTEYNVRLCARDASQESWECAENRTFTTDSLWERIAIRGGR